LNARNESLPEQTLVLQEPINFSLRHIVLRNALLNFLPRFYNMLGSQVASDLDLGNYRISTLLPWGHTQFQKRLGETQDDVKKLKKIQLPLAAFKKHTDLNTEVRETLKGLSDAVADVEICIGETDPMAEESIKQIFFSKDAQARFLNSNKYYLNLVYYWKSLVLPGFSVLAPLLGILVPFFLLKLVGRGMTVPDYMIHLRASILKQISVPSFLRARTSEDRIGGFFEMLFIGFTVVMFISGIWNQVSAALHLRSIWNQLVERGGSVSLLLKGASSILNRLDSAPAAAKKAFKGLIDSGKVAIQKCSKLLEGSPIVCTGSLWNDASAIYDLRTWLGLVDAYTALATMPICIVKYVEDTGVHIKGLVHPYLQSCVPNNYVSAGHSVLTGPNRGGKSTFCKALGLAFVTAQSWGYAAAEKMTLRPFGAIHTALEPAGKLGYASTFEAEIVFAKAVLDRDERPLFVMMDEIFHSTNAVDGIRASSVFMNSLYAKQDTMSLISTHYRELATKFDSQCAAYKMVASDGPTGLVYSYKIDDGVSDKSSVDELLRSYGLLEPGASAENRGFQEQKNDAAESE
jgi:hypothetical protein